MRLRNRHLRHLREAVSDATLAASVHNSQPWLFAVSDDAVAVHLDPRARPRVIDRDGRWVLESLGAATANLELGLRFRTGRRTMTRIFPASTLPVSRSADVLLDALADAPVAVVTFGEADTVPDEAEQRLYDAIPARRTSRGPLYGELDPETWAFASRAGTVHGQGSHVRVVRPEPAASAALVDLTRTVDARWRDDVAYLAEIERWTERVDARGIPRTRIGPHDPTGGVPQRDFAVSFAGQSGAGPGYARVDVFEVSPQLLVMVGKPETPRTWVRAGMAMQRVMLAATAQSCGVGVLGQLVEDDEARAEAGSLLDLSDGEVVQQVLRLGTVDPDRGDSRSPRRPVRDVVA